MSPPLPPTSGSGQDSASEGYLPVEDDVLIEVDGPPPVLDELGKSSTPGRVYLIRTLALLCACSLSIGSHYAQYILGPLKSRLAREMGTNNTEFSLLISAFSLNSTWTPLVGGILASKLGTTYTSILATGTLFLGQALLLLGNMTDSVRLMTFGLFVFGLGVSPLAVVQESIIVRFFRSHGLGVSLALGLVAGKGCSFIAARTSYPLADAFGPHAPFFVATALTAVSFIVNLIYMSASHWLVRGAGVEPEPSELRIEARRNRNRIESLTAEEAANKVAEKRRVSLGDVTKLGDVFWAYVGLNVLCGMIWAPFLHLAANVVERRFGLEERDASIKASYLLSGSILLYPITGIIVDRVKKQGVVIHLLLGSSLLTLFGYLWLSLPPWWTRTPMPAIVSYALGHGFSPLLLVVIVPQLVPHNYISTALGAHKALEQTGSTIFSTLAGLTLDVSKHTSVEAEPAGNDRDVQNLLNVFVILNVAQLASVLGLAWLERRQKRITARAAAVRGPLMVQASEDDDENVGRGRSSSRPSERRPLLSPGRPIQSYSGRLLMAVRTPEELRRGELFSVMCTLLICFAWVLFLTTAWMKLRSKEERGLN